MKAITNIIILSIMFVGLYGLAIAQEGIPARMGAGNFTNGTVSSAELDQFQALNAAGVGMARFNLYPNKYWQNNQPRTDVMDSIMVLAYDHGITPMVLLEHYGATNGAPGSYNKWFSIGSAFATRFRPNGDWGQEHGISDFGINIYSAFNEPDAESVVDRMDTVDYMEALQGLADGVHSVDNGLKVIPGGFMSANAFSDWTLRDYGLVLAPLWNDGTLDGIDLHTYLGQYAPLNQYLFSAQNNFNRIKQACGVDADVNFYATEFNYNRIQEPVSEDTAAMRLLVSIWDNLGVTGNDSSTSVSQLAFVWNQFDTLPALGIAQSLDPWVPKARGEVWQMVAQLTDGLEFTQLDPTETGTYVLESPEKKLWVWQNLNQWSSEFGTDFTIDNIPVWADRVIHYKWNGPVDTLNLSGQSSYTYSGLEMNQCHMFLAQEAQSVGVEEHAPSLSATFRDGYFQIDVHQFSEPFAVVYDLLGRKVIYGSPDASGKIGPLPKTLAGQIVVLSVHDSEKQFTQKYFLRNW